MDELLKQIGRPYEMSFEDGNYQGCFYPVYFLNPELPKYPLPTKDPADSWHYGVKLINHHAEHIKDEDVQAGDVLVTKYNNELHVGIMLNKHQVVHVFKNHTLQVSRLRFFGDRKLAFYRVN